MCDDGGKRFFPEFFLRHKILSRNFVLANATPLEEKPNAQAIGVCTALRGPPMTSRQTVNWSSYIDAATQTAFVKSNLLGQSGVTSGLDAVRSVYIDNTFCPVAVYIQFPDTLFTVVCPPYSICCSPVYTAVQDFSMYATDFPIAAIYQTNFFLSNVDRQGFVISPALTVQQPPEGLSLAYTSSQTISANTSGWIWNDVPIGEPDATRMIIMPVVLTTDQTSTGIYNGIANVTIGGVLATLDHSNSLLLEPQTPKTFKTQQTCYIYRALVPTGDTAQVIVTLDTALAVWADAGFYSITNAFDTSAPFSTLSQELSDPVEMTATAYGSITGSISVAAGSVIIDVNAGYRYTTPANPATVNFSTINTSTDGNGANTFNNGWPGTTRNFGSYYNFSSALRFIAGDVPITATTIQRVAACYF